MRAKYYVIMFALCFCVWTILVDNMVIPSMHSLKQDVGAFSRYRVKTWGKRRNLNKLLNDELLVYAIVDNREKLYYIEYKPNFEYTLKNLPQGTPVQLRYVTRFPKFWKRNLYDLRVDGQSIMGYSSFFLAQKQKEIWKITGVMGGIYLLLVIVGLLNRPRRT